MIRLLERFLVSKRALNELAELREKQELLEKRYRDVELEWTDMFEKLSRTLAALRTRERRANGAGPEHPSSAAEQAQERILRIRSGKQAMPGGGHVR